jgi:competence ComEA-like helix-hairpin-helix protein
MSFARSHLAPASQRLLVLLLPAIIFSGCMKRDFTQSRNLTALNPASAQQTSNPRININTAPAGELEKLPGIGQALAARIVEHREKYGPFRRPEYLIIVRGISDKRFRALREMITVE